MTRVKSAQWLKRQEEHRDDEWALRGELVEAGRRQLLKFRDGTKGATLGDVARALELASKLGRLATGMATDRTEVTGEDGGPIKVELEVALKKIYGDGATRGRGDAERIVDAEVVETGNADPPSLDASSGGTREGRS